MIRNMSLASAGRDNRTGFRWLSRFVIGTPPRLPQPGKRERLAAIEFVQKGLLDLALLLSLVVPVSDDQAAAFFQGRAEGRLRCCVAHQSKDVSFSCSLSRVRLSRCRVGELRSGTASVLLSLVKAI